MNKALVFLFLVVILSFLEFLRPGFPSLQDQMHPLRLTDMIQCLHDRQIPCRYSTKSALGYGYPLFNFYGQGSYLLPSLLSFVLPLNPYDLMKIQILFISLIGSYGVFLYARSNKLDNLVSIMFATIFSLAPYFALNIFVRGAIPEFSALMLIPWVFYLSQQKKVILLSFLMSFIVLTHVQTGLLLLLLYTTYLLFLGRPREAIKSMVVALLLASFYLIPAILESKFVQISSTTKGFFDYNVHFLSIKQIFTSTFWGYGASTWLDKDGMGFLLGWPVIALIIFNTYLYFKQKHNKVFNTFLLIIPILLVFLAHTQSTFIWKIIPLSFYQFPWRFLGLATVFTVIFSIKLFSQSKVIIKPVVAVGLIFITVVICLPYFQPDQKLTYDYLNSLPKQTEISMGGINDYWPTTAKTIPAIQAPDLLLSFKSSSQPITTSFIRKSNSINVLVSNPVQQEIIIPMSYYPGWEMYINHKLTNIDLDTTLGFPILTLGPGQYQIDLLLRKTKVQKYSEYLSILTLIVLIFIKIKHAKQV